MSDKTEVTSKPIDIKSDNSPKLDKLGRAYATGRRKESVSRVWIKRGSGKVIVNGKSSDKYFSRSVLRMLLEEPLKKTDRFSEIEVFSTVSGGGLSGQAGAIRLGIARALVLADPDNRPLLKSNGLLTRDSRKVERKKPGQPGARKKFQFSKR